jgi:hypothetical protein
LTLVGGEQGLAINAAAADAVSLCQIGQVERLAEIRYIAVAVVDSGIVGLLIVAQRGAALFQGSVKAIELQADAAAIVIRLIEHLIGNGVRVQARFERGDAGACAGIAAISQVRNDAMGGKQVQLEVAHTAAGEVRVFVQHDAGAEQRIGKGGQKVEVRDIAVVEVEIVDTPLFGVHVDGVIGIAAPVVGAHVQAVEEAFFGIDDDEIQAQEAGTLAQIDYAAIDVVVAAGAGEAVAEVHAAGNPLLGGGGGGGGRRGGGVGGGGGGRRGGGGVGGGGGSRSGSRRGGGGWRLGRGGGGRRRRRLCQKRNCDKQSQCEPHLSSSWST